jgi:ATP-binding protein involved in chromosome partitioning
MHGTNDKDAQDVRIYDNLKQIKNVIMVLSGKGGVGKSTVSVNLAHSLAMAGHSVGIMDVDVHGPNVPKMLGIEDRQFSGEHEAIEPVEVLPNLHAASIALVGYDPKEALIWRGPMKIGLVRQFLGDVKWGELDYLIIDTPPGTGDEALTTAQLIPQMKGAVIVTSPQDVSILDSRKSMTFAEKLELPILGIIENMSGYVCSHCGQVTDIFGKGGGQMASDAVGVPFLGSVPIDPGIVVAGDQGRPFLAQFPERPAAIAFKEIIGKIDEQIEKNTSEGIYDGKEPEDPRIAQSKKKEALGDFRPLQ